MPFPIIQGKIRRRLLVNYRIDAKLVERLLPQPLHPKLQRGFAVGGICLIRLEGIRPSGLPAFTGLSSENAAHRIAVEWEDAEGLRHEGVYIARRDTGSLLNAFGGGRLFPGEHRLARFAVEDDGDSVTLKVQSGAPEPEIELAGRVTEAWPAGSCFGSLAASSAFFAAGKVGYSVTRQPNRLDGMRLETEGWEVRPFAVERLRSAFFEDRSLFPASGIAFDHALVMRDLRHEWHSVEDFRVGPKVF